MLILKELQGELAVHVRVVDLGSVELAVLVMFYQVVVRVAGEGQRAESENVHCRELQQFQVWFGRGQVDYIEANYVMAQQEVCALGLVVQPGQGSVERLSSVGEYQGLAAVRVYCRECVDALIFYPYFEIQGETTG